MFAQKNLSLENDFLLIEDFIWEKDLPVPNVNFVENHPVPSELIFKPNIWKKDFSVPFAKNVSALCKIFHIMN